MRRLRGFLLVGSLLGALLWAGPSSPAHATTVVHVDVAVASSVGQPTSCVGVLYPTCTTSYSGGGLTIDGLQTWTLTMTVSSFRPCYSPNSGTWQLTSSAGNGLSGTLSGFSWEPLTMAVTGGTGAYAGASAPGTVQNFRQPLIPDPLHALSGCEGAIVVGGLYVGSLDFHL